MSSKQSQTYIPSHSRERVIVAYPSPSSPLSSEHKSMTGKSPIFGSRPPHGVEIESNTGLAVRLERMNRVSSETSYLPTPRVIWEERENDGASSLQEPEHRTGLRRNTNMRPRVPSSRSRQASYTSQDVRSEFETAGETTGSGDMSNLEHDGSIPPSMETITTSFESVGLNEPSRFAPTPSGAGMTRRNSQEDIEPHAQLPTPSNTERSLGRATPPRPPPPTPTFSESSAGQEQATASLSREKADPQACLFVASLAAAKSDTELYESVSTYFANWGHLLNVKVMRDYMGRPYAFVQFKDVEEAQQAMTEAHNTILDGRHIRIEQARVNRTLFLAKIEKNLSEEQIKATLSAYGPIEELTLLHDYETGRSKGCGFVKFSYREDAIDAFSGLRSGSNWVVEWATNMERGTGAARTDAERSSIFVGQLNPGLITQELLEERFGEYGEMESCVLVNKTGPGFSARPAFAFIKYTRPQDAEEAIRSENTQVWLDRTIRVQHREQGDGHAGLTHSRTASGASAFSFDVPPHIRQATYELPMEFFGPSGISQPWTATPRYMHTPAPPIQSTPMYGMFPSPYGYMSGAEYIPRPDYGGYVVVDPSSQPVVTSGPSGQGPLAQPSSPTGIAAVPGYMYIPPQQQPYPRPGYGARVAPPTYGYPMQSHLVPQSSRPGDKGYVSFPYQMESSGQECSHESDQNPQDTSGPGTSEIITTRTPSSEA